MANHNGDSDSLVIFKFILINQHPNFLSHDLAVVQYISVDGERGRVVAPSGSSIYTEAAGSNPNGLAH